MCVKEACDICKIWPFQFVGHSEIPWLGMEGRFWKGKGNQRIEKKITFQTKVWKKIKSGDRFLTHNVQKIGYSFDIYPFEHCYTIK